MRLGWVLALLCVLAACRARDRGPNLVELQELGPRHVEVGDRLRLLGSGFPEGRAAKLTLRGDLHRAGEPPLRDVELRADAELVSPHALEVPLSGELARALCGGADASHTTFRGDVEVAFSPRTSSGSVVTGRLDGVVVDVTPDAQSASAVAALRAQGDRFAKFLGASLASTEEGLIVAALEPRSRASRAGLVAGDLLIELDGMVLRGSSDFVPAPNARSSSLVVRRGSESVPLRVESAGFRYSSPETLASAVGLIGLALFAFALFCSPFGRLLGFFERRVSERLREGALPLAPDAAPAPRATRLARALLRQLPAGFLPYFGLVTASCLFTLLALGKSVVASELDLLVVPAATSVSLFALALVTGEAQGRFSVRAGVARALSLLALSLPLGALIVTAALGAGSLRAEDLVYAQGAWPWQWGLFQSPVLLISGALAFAALVPRARQVSAVSPRVHPGVYERAIELAQGVHQLVSVGVLAVVLFGGWQLGGPGASFGVSVLGALLLLVKSWLLLLAVAFVRWALEGVDLRALGAATHAWIVVPSGLCVVAALLFRRSVQHPVLAALESGLGPVLFLGGLLGVAWFCLRILQGARGPNAEHGVQPWV